MHAMSGVFNRVKKGYESAKSLSNMGELWEFPCRCCVEKKIKHYHAAALIEVKACSCVASAIIYIMEKNCCFNKTIFEEKCNLPTDTFPGILPSIRQVERAHMIKMQIYIYMAKE